MSSKSSANTNTTSTGVGGEFKITFYSTSPKEESKSKYPIQTRTSYTLDQCGGGDTEINFGKPLAPRPKTRVTGFKTDRKKKDEIETTTESKKRNKLDSSSNPLDSNVKSRSGRICKKPKRYEPVETVTDDFDDGDYDSDDSFEN